MILAPLYARAKGNVFLEQLNWIDGTTILLVGALILRGIVMLRDDTDLQAVSIALIGALSFVFAFEALYKLSFYITPRFMALTERREIVIQTGTALTALAGFAFGKFSLSRLSLIFLLFFVIEWALWLLLGYPQLFTDQLYYPAVFPIPVSWGGVYWIGRTTKTTLFLVYFFFYARHKD